jgi:polyisoprenoid-binding protein YceI
MFRRVVPCFALLFAISSLGEKGTWKIDPAHLAAQFSVRHLGISTVRGAFTKVSGRCNTIRPI